MLARRSLAPIGYIASNARSITSNNLNERLAARGTDDEMDNLIRTIDDLTILSKFDSSEMVLERVPLRLDLLIKDICSLFQVRAEQKITLEVNSAQEIIVLGDKARLQQLFTNLIDNAVKFAHEQGSIQIAVTKNNGAARVMVRDEGVGIPEEDQEKIFKRFYRVDKSRSRETGGVGLGLSIVEWIAGAHQGRIEVDSELNRGSSFIVYLPILKE